MRVRVGSTSFSNSRRFAAKSLTRLLSPVMLPPGWSMLATRVNGSAVEVMTMGVVPLAFLAGHHHINVQTNELGRERREPFGSAVRGAVFDDQIATLDVGKFAQRISEGREVRGVLGQRQRFQHTDAPDFRPLLPMRRNRPSRRAAEQRDDLAPPDHSITSSARVSSVDGTDKPRALAVVRLMTRSNLIGCSTGTSAGFAPRRILST